MCVWMTTAMFHTSALQGDDCLILSTRVEMTNMHSTIKLDGLISLPIMNLAHSTKDYFPYVQLIVFFAQVTGFIETLDIRPYSAIIHYSEYQTPRCRIIFIVVVSANKTKNVMITF